MKPPEILFYGTVALWILSEIYYSQKLKSEASAEKKDLSTLGLLWIVIVISVSAAIFVSKKFSFRMTENPDVFYIGLAFIFIGVVIRFIIIRSLGKYFTVDVSVRKDHRIIKDGFYKYVRHPSYTMCLLTFLGLGINMNNWLSLFLVFVPVVSVFLYRIKIEEQALEEKSGTEYRTYKSVTKKLIPFIY